MQMKFFLPMKPPTVTHQEKEIRCVKGKPIVYEGEKLKDARAKLRAFLAPYRPEVIITSPVMLMVKWCFPMVKGAADGQYKHTRPDTDNLQKLLKDCMTDLKFWKDDALVVSEHIEKFWAKVPGIYIEIIEIGGKKRC